MSTDASVKTLVIDGRDVGATGDQTILEVAREHGIRIPTLCHLEGLMPVGACRMCLVEVVGSNKLLPACVTKVTEGMEVRTHTPELKELRRMTLELLFAERNHICSICVSNGHCQLQALAVENGIDHIRFPYQYPRLQVDTTHPRYGMDPNRCVLCGRCVRVCAEVEGAHVWDMMGRGSGTLITAELRTPWGLAKSCTSCGKCVQVCPTGALFEKGRAVAEMEKRRDFVPAILAGRDEEDELMMP